MGRLLPLSLLVMSAVLPASATLHSEALSFLERLHSRGYTAMAVKVLELDLLEPCTLMVYPPAASASEGFYAALGGNFILDLGLRLEGDGWFLEDSLHDDLPVLGVDSAQISEGRRLIVCARDMLMGARRDSAAVVWAFSPVDRDP